MAAAAAIDPRSNKIGKLHQLGEIVRRSLIGQPYAARVAARREAALRLLAAREKRGFLFFWKRFALTLSSALIRNTSLQGGYLRESITASRQFIASSLAGKETLFSREIPTGVLELLDQKLQIFETFEKELPPYSDEPTEGEVIEKGADQILRLIAEQLARGEAVYMPIGYRASPANQGHDMACKIEEEEGVVKVHIFNLGNGSSSHPILGCTANQKLSSYTFLPIHIRKKVFFGKVGRAAICHLIRYQRDLPLPGKTYEGSDIYDIFLQLALLDRGLSERDLGANQQEFAARSQNVGNCPEVAVRCVMDDVLISNRVAKGERRKFFLAMDFSTLIDAYNDYKGGAPSSVPRKELILDQAKSLSAKLIEGKEAKELSIEEVTAAEALLHEIIESVRKDSSVEKEEGRVRERGVIQITTAPRVKGERTRAPLETQPMQLPKITLTPPQFRGMETIQSDLGEWIRIASQLPPKNAFRYVSDCLKTLPLPINRTKRPPPFSEAVLELIEDPTSVKEEGIDVWETLPEREIGKVIDLLEALLQRGLRQIKIPIPGYTEQGSFVDLFLTIYTPYAIVDKLARRCEERTKLEGTTSPFLPGFPFLFNLPGFTSLPVAEDNIRMSRITSYFGTDQRERNDLFPIGELPVELFVEDCIEERFPEERIQGINQVAYLMKIVGKKRDFRQSDYVDLFCKQWLTLLQPEVQALYRFAYLSLQLFSEARDPFDFVLSFEPKQVADGKGVQLKNRAILQAIEQHRVMRNKRHYFTKESSFLEQGVPSPFSFVGPLSEPFRTLDSNGAIAFYLSERRQDPSRLPEAMARLLLYNTRRGSLSAFQTLQELSLPGAFAPLTYVDGRELIDISLFQPRYLLERLEENGEPLIRKFRGVISDRLQDFGVNVRQLSASLFLLREGICFEGFIPKDPHREAVLSTYRNHLETLLKIEELRPSQYSDIFHHLILLDGERELADPTEFFARLFTAPLLERYDEKGEAGTQAFLRQYSQTHTTEAPWIGWRLPSMISKAAYRYAPLLSNQEMRDQICHRILSEAMKKEAPPPGTWSGTFPQYRSGDLVIDFFQGTISSCRFGGVLKRNELTFNDQIAPDLFREKYGNLLWVDEMGRKVSLHGEFEYSPDTGEWIVTDKREAVVSPSRGQELENLTPLNLIHMRQADGTTLLIEPALKQRLFRIEANGMVRKLDPTPHDSPEIRPLPYLLSDLESAAPFISIAPPERVLCFVHEKTGQVEELTLHWDPSCHFIRNSEGELEFQEQPGFIIIGDPAKSYPPQVMREYRLLQKELGGFKEALPLFNPKTKEWRVILPSAVLQQEEEDFSKAVSADLRRGYGGNFYTFDPQTSLLHPIGSSENELNLFLALLFKLQRDIPKAHRYLDRVSSSERFDQSEAHAMEQFMEHKDSSSESIAFNLKLFNIYLKNETLLLQKRFDPMPDPPWYPLKGTRKWCQWGMNVYTDYVGLLNQSGSGLIPEELQLSPAVEAKLLDAFLDYYEEEYKQDPLGWEGALQRDHPLIYVRRTLYRTEEQTATFTLPPQEIILHPSCFPQKPESLTGGDILGNYYKAHEGRYAAPVRTTLERYTESDSRIGRCQGGALVLGQAKPASKQINLKSLSMQTDPKNSGCPTPAEPILESRAVYPNQIELATVHYHFPQIYEQARRCHPHRLDPFDFTLQAILKSPTLPDEVVQLLFWVRYFADHFQGEEYSLEGLTPSKIAQYESKIGAIVTKIHSLRSLDPVKYDLLRRKREFTVPGEFSLSLTLKPGSEDLPRLIDHPPLTSDAIEEEVLRLLNTPYTETILGADAIDEETQFLLERDQTTEEEEFSVIAERVLKRVILKNNLSYLQSIRPMLSREKMDKICWLVNEWNFIRCKKRGATPYDADKYPNLHQTHPEIFYFYLKTGKFPRAEQLETYLWVTEGLQSGKNRHFQLPAGGGKTDVLIPLFHLAAKRLGKTPVTCVTASMYPIEKYNLAYNLKMLDDQLAYLEVGMHQVNRLTPKDLKKIYFELENYRQEWRGLIITRHTYDALALTYDLACQKEVEPDTEEELLRGDKIHWSHKILQFFKEDCLLICDESHQNGDPTTRSIYGVGPAQLIPKEEALYLLKLMKALPPSSAAAPTPVELRALQERLAREYAAQFDPSFVPYFTDQSAPQPPLLRTWAKEEDPRANLAALTSHFLLTLLPEMLQLQTDTDHGRSPYSERPHEVPYHNTVSSTAEYNDPYKAAVLTIKGVYKRGIEPTDLKKMLHKLFTESVKERQRRGCNPHQTANNREFMSWLEGTPYQKTILEELNFDHQPLWDKLTPFLTHNPQTIDFFLEKEAFPSIATPPGQIASTTTRTFEGFSSLVLFSATPNPKLSYPKRLDPDFKKDRAFKAAVKRQLLAPQNQSRVFIQDVPSLLAVLEARKEVTILIDPRAFLSSYPRETFVKEWMKKNPTLDAVLFYQESNAKNVVQNEKLFLMLKEGTVFPLEGNEIQKAFRQHGLNWETMRVATIYDAAHSQSTHILQKPDAIACFIPWEGLTTSHTLQAVMRLRGFLQEQRIIWAFQTDLARKIFKIEEAPLTEFLAWTQANEREQKNKQIILNAFQEIAHAIEAKAREEIAAAHEEDDSDSLSLVVETAQKYKKGFVESQPRDSYEAFGEHQVLHKPRAVLHRFAATLYRKFNYETPLEEEVELSAKIEAVIQSLEQYGKIEGIHTAHLSEGSRETEQQFERLIEMEQMTLRPPPLKLKKLAGEYGDLSIFHPDYPRGVQENGINLTSPIANSPFWTKRLYFDPNQLLTAESEEGREVIKPVQYFMIVAYPDARGSQKVIAVTTSNQILATNQEHLIHCPRKVRGLNHTAFLVSADGELVQPGRGPLAPSPRLIEETLQSPWMRDLTVDAALLRGQIPHPELLVERIREQGWETFETLWHHILKGLPRMHDTHTEVFAELKRRFAP